MDRLPGRAYNRPRNSSRSRAVAIHDNEVLFCVAIDIILLIVTAGIGYHGLTWRDEDGKPDSVRLLFGCIALMFFMRVLFADVLGVWG